MDSASNDIVHATAESGIGGSYRGQENYADGSVAGRSETSDKPSSENRAEEAMAQGRKPRGVCRRPSVGVAPGASPLDPGAYAPTAKAVSTQG